MSSSLLCADDLAALRADGLPVVFLDVPYDQPDICSECDEGLIDPFPSTLVVVYERYGRICEEPTCGRLCTGQKVRDLLAAVKPPAFIHIHVIQQKHMIEIEQAEEAA